MDAVRFAGLAYTYPAAPRAALRGIDLRIGDGLTLLAGDSGSGKSTLLRVCNGLVPHFHGGTIGGVAAVFGHQVTRTPTRELARHVGFVFQDPELQAVYARVERDVAFGLENLRVPPRQMRERVAEALELCGIAALRDRTMATLSGGERQRVALAGVLAMRPRLLVLDEPLSQLDPDGASAVAGALQAAVRRGAIALVAEHRDRLLRPLASRTIAIAEGLLVNPDSLTRRPSVAADDDVPRRAVVDGGFDVTGVTAGYRGRPVLHGVALEAAAGDVIAVTGRNGSGKTTLLRTIAGLLPALRGSVARKRGRVAYLPQNPTSLLHRQTLRSEVEWTLRHDRGGPSADDVLRQFALAQVAERYPRDLSTGERQRAALAAALAGAPVVALLDEPTRGMDASARTVLAGAIRRLACSGVAVVLATHDDDLVELVASRVVELRDGGAVERRPAVVSTA